MSQKLMNFHTANFIIMSAPNILKIRSQMPQKMGVHQENISVKCVPPQTHFYKSKTGVYRGIPIILIFDPKQRLWVLVRTAPLRRF